MKIIPNPGIVSHQIFRRIFRAHSREGLARPRANATLEYLVSNILDKKNIIEKTKALHLEGFTYQVNK